MNNLRFLYAISFCILAAGCAQNPVYKSRLAPTPDHQTQPDPPPQSQTQPKEQAGDVMVLKLGNETESADKEQTSAIPSRQYYLPKGIVKIKVTREAGKLDVIEVSSRIIPDTASRYNLYRDHHPGYEDKFKIQTDQNGLLTAINTTTTFKGGEIIQAVGAIAGAAAKIGIASVPQRKEPPKDCPPAFIYEIEIDPFEIGPDVINSKYFAQRCLDISFKLGKINKPDANVKEVNAILYRGLKFFPITINSTHSDIQNDFYVGIPDRESPPSEYSIYRGHFVDRDIKLTFLQGVLTEDETSYPSEVLGFLSLPLKLLNGISQAITGRFDARTTELNNEKAYLEALKGLNEAKTK